MFISKRRPIAIPQHEHGRMAGSIASLWGNTSFQRPRLDFNAFVMGVTFHDWGYGLIDNLPIGKAPEQEWLKVIRNGYRHTFEHPVTDVIVKLHIRRLLGYKDSPERKTAIEELDGMIARRLETSGHSLEDFHWADRITNLCDYIAFYFAFEEPIDQSFAVHPQSDSSACINIRVTTNLDGDIRLNPWPLCVPEYPGFIFGYNLETYPQILEPVRLPFRLVQV